jgi:hypothetical protein
MKRALVLSIPLLFFFGAVKGADLFAKPVKEKIITIRVIPNGNIYMDQDTLGTEMLSTILRDRLFKSYKGTGKMYQRIEVIFDGEVPTATRSAVINGIKEAQEKALTELSLQLHSRRFDQLSPRQQSKIKKQFPVLFQNF